VTVIDAGVVNPLTETVSHPPPEEVVAAAVNGTPAVVLAIWRVCDDGGVEFREWLNDIDDGLGTRSGLLLMVRVTGMVRGELFAPAELTVMAPL
jgi:hypothetical protein